MVASRPRQGLLAGLSEPWARLAVNLKIFRRCFSLIGNFIVFDDLPLIQAAEASLFDGGDMDKLGSLPVSRQRQLAATDELDFGMVFRCPIGSGNIRRLSPGRTGQCRHGKQRRGRRAGTCDQGHGI
jgi:hypothetical protein